MSRRAWILFAAMSVIWGIPYLFIKIAVAELSPVSVVFARVAVAALVLLPVALSRGALGGLRRQVAWLAALALLEVVIPFPLISAGEQRIPSSLTGLLISTEPLVVALLAIWLDPAERVSGTRFAGLVIGLVGVVTLLGVDVAGSGSALVGAGMVLLATACYANGAMLVKRKLATENSLGVSTVAVTLSTLLLAPAAWRVFPAHVPSAGVIASLLVLGVVCTAAGFIVFFALIAAAGPSRATVITYVNPAVAGGAGRADYSSHSGRFPADRRRLLALDRGFTALRPRGRSYTGRVAEESRIRTIATFPLLERS